MYIIQIYSEGPINGTPVVGPTFKTVCLVSDDFLHMLKANHVKTQTIAYLSKTHVNELDLEKMLGKSGFYFETKFLDTTKEISELDLEDGKYYILKENRNKYSIWRYNKAEDDLFETGVLCNFDVPPTYFVTQRQFTNVVKQILDIDGDYFPPNN